MNAAEEIFDPSAMRLLKAEVTDVPNVWRITLPTRPWKFSGAEKERQSMVEKLSAAFPHRALWLSDWASEGHTGWCFLARGEPITAFDDELSKGAWVLFFFEHAPGKVLDALIPTELTSAAEAACQVFDLGGAAAIWSWYDDTEWLVVLPRNWAPQD